MRPPSSVECKSLQAVHLAAIWTMPGLEKTVPDIGRKNIVILMWQLFSSLYL